MRRDVPSSSTSSGRTARGSYRAEAATGPERPWTAPCNDRPFVDCRVPRALNRTPFTVSEPPKKKRSPYTRDRGMLGVVERETVTRRRFVTGGALAAGGGVTAAIVLPEHGLALGPIFEKTTHNPWQDV